MEELNKELESLLEDMQALEPLEKGSHKCVRCSNSVSTKGGRCGSCLKKLKSDKKKPGHWQRAQTKADDALRRQDGKNGTASHKSSGRGTRKSIVKQMQSAEKKTGQKLSPDRKNNSKGYAASNTRAVPEKLNRGRHKVDGKKLAVWRKKVKKSEFEFDDMLTLLHSKSYETNPALAEKLEKARVYFGKDKGDKTYQSKFVSEKRCEKCAFGGIAHLSFVMKDTDSKIPQQRDDLKLDKDKTWMHDCSYTAVYFCEDCLEPTVDYNQA